MSHFERVHISFNPEQGMEASILLTIEGEDDRFFARIKGWWFLSNGDSMFDNGLREKLERTFLLWS